MNSNEASHNAKTEDGDEALERHLVNKTSQLAETFKMKKMKENQQLFQHE